jgi:hypothetical protein
MEVFSMRGLGPLFLLALAAAAPAQPAQLAFPEGWTAARGSAVADRAASLAGRVSLRLESPSGDVLVLSPPVSLTIGRRYEIAAWVRTESLEVTDADRTPIAIGAAISMESAPFDVHSESVGGTRGWTQVRLRFTATRASDRVALSAGLGGRMTGRAWFASPTLEEVSQEPEWPAPAAVETYGPAYRYPTGGWIYVHIEGQPYERGYQHGRLMAYEIGQYVNRCAWHLNPSAKEHDWESARTIASALFLRGFDREILEEMKGIADGAKDGGAKWNGRPIDLSDIAAANTITEIGLLRSAVRMTPTGLEGLRFEIPKDGPPPVPDHCSAFAATGPATRDGKMVIAHITMWPLTLAEQTNVMLDVKPATGRRVLMQSYPGGIQSGTDWYQNDAGVVLTETTIRQGAFNPQGRPVAFRARKAIQYGDDVDGVVEHLTRDNNGLYTNEWLIGDAKNNEIAMYELGTTRARLYRSSRNEWFGGTEGFYWGCNNAKDLNVRLEYQIDPSGPPRHVPFVPGDRDVKWQELFGKHKGAIDEQFAFLAFRTAPLVSSSSMDAKATTAEMAKRLMCWATFGKPNQREWAPGQRGGGDSPNAGLYASGYRLIEPLSKAPGKRRAAALPAKPVEAKQAPAIQIEGWILPASDADLWLSVGVNAYHADMRSGDLERAAEERRAAFSALFLRGGDRPPRSITADTRSAAWFELLENKGALLFAALRRELGDEKFGSVMRDFFREHTTRAVSTRQFVEAAEKVAGKSLTPFFAAWLDRAGLPDGAVKTVYMAGLLPQRLDAALIVYGTVLEAGANRFAAEQMQERLLNWFESRVPIRKDFEVADDELMSRNVVFIGRPEANSALAAWKDRIGLKYERAVFDIGGNEHASEAEALVFASANPLDAARMVLIVAGNSALETVRAAASMPFGNFQYAAYREGKRTETGFAK